MRNKTQVFHLQHPQGGGAYPQSGTGNGYGWGIGKTIGWGRGTGGGKHGLTTGLLVGGNKAKMMFGIVTDWGLGAGIFTGTGWGTGTNDIGGDTGAGNGYDGGTPPQPQSNGFALDAIKLWKQSRYDVLKIIRVIHFSTIIILFCVENELFFQYKLIPCHVFFFRFYFSFCLLNQWYYYFIQTFDLIWYSL